MADLLILAHAGTWEGRFQISSLAASTAAAGGEVEVALFFAALARWVDGSWDELDPAPPLTRERLEGLGAPPLAEMIRQGRREGRVRLYACSASLRLLELDPRRTEAAVDAILGWQSFARKIARAGRVVTL